ncbi:MAG TPA: hypothetical protein VFX76_21195, partial [Roseiflexaceae bacterium]|nr:hypothetical protein [Roseiflexaceae bacterium]
THNHVVSLRPSMGDRCISTVDLANLAAGLVVLRQSVPSLAARASALLNAMEWDWLYDANVGLMYGCRFPDGSASDWHYDWLAADSRLAYVFAIGTDRIPAAAWNKLNRDHEPPRCVSADVWHFDPGWDGGGLFMAFLPALFVDEAESELGTSARNFVLDYICFAKQKGAPAWGQSATALPPFGKEYFGYGELRDEIIVPHASLLAVESVGSGVLIDNLKALEAMGARQAATDGTNALDFGFRSSVNWKTGAVSTDYLVLDQSMVFLSLMNVPARGYTRRQSCQDPIIRAAIARIADYASSC